MMRRRILRYSGILVLILGFLVVINSFLSAPRDVVHVSRVIFGELVPIIGIGLALYFLGEESE